MVRRTRKSKLVPFAFLNGGDGGLQQSPAFGTKNAKGVPARLAGDDVIGEGFGGTGSFGIGTALWFLLRRFHTLDGNYAAKMFKAISAYP